MSHRKLTLWRKRAGAALFAAVTAFLLSQIVLSAHAAKYGDGPHKHDGQVCVLSIATHNGDKAIANAAVVLAVAIAVWRIALQFSQPHLTPVAVRAARPRGPPQY